MTRFLLFLLVLGVAVGVTAQTTPPPNAAGAAAAPAATANPYSATVPVAGTSDDQRNAAIAAALTQVLQQVAPGLAASPDALAQASGYVRDFHYRRAASGNGLELQVDFDPGAVSRLLAASQATAASAGSAASPGGIATAAAGGGGSGNLWVDGIDNSHAFASLLATLRSDAGLHDVTPVAAEGDGVLLHLGFDQPLATVLAGLTGPSGHLTADAQPHPGADAALHWTP